MASLAELELQIEAAEKADSKRERSEHFELRTGRTMDSIVNYADLRDVCASTRSGAPWHYVLFYLENLPAQPADEIVRNIVVPLAFLGDCQPRRLARGILERIGYDGPLELAPDLIVGEEDFRRNRLRERD